MSESSSDCEARTGSGLHHAEYKAGPEAGSFDREDSGRLLGSVGQTARRHEVPRPTAALRQGQHPVRCHAEDTTEVGRITISCTWSPGVATARLVAWVGFPAAFVCLLFWLFVCSSAFSHDISKTDEAGITKLDDMLYQES